MILNLLAAAGLVLTSPTSLNEPKTEDSFQEICREAVDWKNMRRGSTDDYTSLREGEAYVGRLQLSMDKRNLDQEDRAIADIVCRVYIAASSDQLKFIEDALKKEPSKVAMRP